MKNCITLILLSLGLLMVTSDGFGQGNGSDGALNVSSGTVTINNVATPVSGSNAPGNTINVVSTLGFAVGDLALVMQMYGTNAGSYDELKITSLTGTSLTFASSTSVTYSNLSVNKAQVIRIPQYTTVNVSSGATLTAPAWDGNVGGVLIYYANGLVTMNGTTTMNAKGFTGGTGATGNAAGTAGTAGTGAGSAGVVGGNASPATGGAGGYSDAGDGGTGGQGNSAAVANPGTSGTGIGAGTSGIGGANMSVGTGTLIMGGGGGGGQGGRGGQYGGSGGGGGASSLVLGASGAGGTGSPGTGGTASTAVGGNGGTGGGIILMRINSMTGNGAIVSNGSNGTNGTGTGGNGGNGGIGGNGGAFLTGIALSNGGGGGGGGRGGQGGQGSGGGGGGGAGVIVITTYIGTPSWTGAMSNTAGAGGTGGAGGTSGTSAAGGNGGFGFILGSAGVAGSAGGAVPPGLAGPTGTPNPLSIPPIILPVSILDFTGVLVHQAIQLKWNTTFEESNHSFIVEKSADGHRFELLERLNSNASSSYSLTDQHPYKGQNYYRLKQVNGEGQTTEVRMIEVDYLSDSDILHLFPNPVVDKIIYVRLGEKASVSFRMYNLLGALVFSTTSDFQADQNSITLPSSLESGVYTVELVSSVSEIIRTEKIIVH